MAINLNDPFGFNDPRNDLLKPSPERGGDVLKRPDGLSDTAHAPANRKTSIKYKDGPLQGNEYDFASAFGIRTSSEEARKLRNKILAANDKTKNSLEKTYPQVLIPMHSIRIFRHVINYDENTGYIKNGQTDQATASEDTTQSLTEAEFGIGNKLKEINLETNAVTGIVEQSLENNPDPGISYFEVVPQDGYHDFLGIKFSYSYDETITTFTITINNERGKNKNTFMSGDVIEFFFDLVDDKALAAAEKDSLFIEHDHRSTKGLPMVFTGMLENIELNDTSDGLTVVWSGRNGAYILTQREVHTTYPLQSIAFGASNASMSYEQILWEMIVKHTGMVVGEVDLGNYQLFSRFGQEAVEFTPDKFASGELNGIDLMGDGSLQSQYGVFRSGLEEILKKNPFSVYKEVGSKEYRVRWSALLAFDLLQPRVFSLAEISLAEISAQGATGGRAVAGLESGMLAGYRWGSNSKKASSEYNSIPPNIRFKTKLGLDLFQYQYKLATRNAPMILRKAPIKAEVKTDSGNKFYLISFDAELENELGNCGNLELLKKSLYQKMMGMSDAEFNKMSEQLQMITMDRWNKALSVAYKEATSAKPMDMWFQIVTNEAQFRRGNVGKVPGRKNIDYNSMPIQTWLINPESENGFTYGGVLAVPIDPSVIYRQQTDAAKGEVEINGAVLDDSGGLVPVTTQGEAVVMDVSTVFNVPLEYLGGKSILINIAPAAAPVSGVTNGGGGGISALTNYVVIDAWYNDGVVSKQVITNRRVVNNLALIAQMLDNTGVFNVAITQSALNSAGGLNKMVLPDRYELKAKTDTNFVGKKDAVDTYTMTPHTATGKAIDAIKEILDKFFACVLYVDEYNIAHIRPRYKNLQAEKDVNSKTAPPIWGLYAGQPVYPRIFKATFKDQLKSTPNAVIVFGQNNFSGAGDGQLVVRADHGILQGRFGEYQVMTDANNATMQNKYEGYNIAKNILLNHVRNAFSASIECDVIPDLRPGHRIDVVDFVTGMVGRFIAENVQWEYSKDTGLKMTLQVASMMLVSDDAYTVAAMKFEGKLANYETTAMINSNNYGDFALGAMLRDSNVEAGKSKSKQAMILEQEKTRLEMEVYDETRGMPEFFLGVDGGVVEFKGRSGFENPVDPEKSG